MYFIFISEKMARVSTSPNKNSNDEILIGNFNSHEIYNMVINKTYEFYSLPIDIIDYCSGYITPCQYKAEFLITEKLSIEFKIFIKNFIDIQYSIDKQSVVINSIDSYLYKIEIFTEDVQDIISINNWVKKNMNLSEYAFWKDNN